MLPISWVALVTHAEAPLQEEAYKELKTEWTTDEVKELVNIYADKYGVSRATLHRIVSGESSYQVKPKDGDMNITCPTGINKGNPVRARGAVQITECYFPEVTDEQAYDLEFSLNFLAEKVQKGQGYLWSTY